MSRNGKLNSWIHALKINWKIEFFCLTKKEYFGDFSKKKSFISTICKSACPLTFSTIYYFELSQTNIGKMGARPCYINFGNIGIIFFLGVVMKSFEEPTNT